MLRTIVGLSAYWPGLLLALLLAGPRALGKVRLDTALKTEPQEDPDARDGVSFRALCYHDVRDGLRGTLRDWPEATALDTYDLIQQFEWLRDSGYHVVSLDAVLAARGGGPKLPERAVLLTFDDGYESVYTRVFPLLRLFGYPAIVGLVGEWLEDRPDGKVFYGDRFVPRERFVTWPQVREMVASGLVEVASHSYGLHKGLLGNPQGGMPPAAITRAYDARGKRYEGDGAYLGRLRADLSRSAAGIARETGKRPRVLIWPYGAYNAVGIKAADAEGMPITMSLEAGANTKDQPLARVRRDLLVFNDKVSELKRNLNQQARYDGVEEPLGRIIAVDLDSLYDPDGARQEENVGALIERVLRLRVNTVYLRAVADADGDGLAEAAYFPSRHLPLRADLFNRVAWQLRTRASVPPETVSVYAWLPVLAFKLPASGPAAPVLSPAARRAIREIYEDAGINAPRVAGLVLGADAPLEGAADGSAPGRFPQELCAAFKASQPNAIVARMIAPAAVLASRGGPAPAYASALSQYDFVTVLVPEDGAAGIGRLVDAAARVPGALRSTAFLLPSTSGHQPVPSEQLAAQLRSLQQGGARSFGYYPDRAATDQPAAAVLRQVMSLNANPGRRP